MTEKSLETPGGRTIRNTGRFGILGLLVAGTLCLALYTLTSDDVSWIKSPVSFLGAAALLVSYILYMIVMKHKHSEDDRAAREPEL